MLVIKGELTDLNEYVRIERGNKFAGAKVKREETNRIWVECIQQKIELQKKGCFIVFQWYSKDRRKDKDNVAFAKKFILDGLVLAGVIKSDRWDFISGFLDVFYIDKENPRVEVYFGEEPNRIEIKKMYEIS
ncbi:MAG: hypothetical protein Q7U68_04835 [Candidatus Roizmanbacteria bacterium]|nr:hypothetical protein [Candidatus Roizmanbacteria bacterium]